MDCFVTPETFSSFIFCNIVCIHLFSVSQMCNVSPHSVLMLR